MFCRLTAFGTLIMKSQIIGGDVLIRVILQECIDSLDADIPDLAAGGAYHMIVGNKHLVVPIGLIRKGKTDDVSRLAEIFQTVVHGSECNGGHLLTGGQVNFLGAQMSFASADNG